MMKKVLADFADDADFSGRNILKFFFHAMSLSVSQSAQRFLKVYDEESSRWLYWLLVEEIF